MPVPPDEDSELISHLRKKLVDSNLEMERLRNEMLGMSRELDSKEERIQGLENRIHENQSRILPNLNEQLQQYKREN